MAEEYIYPSLFNRDSASRLDFIPSESEEEETEEEKKKREEEERKKREEEERKKREEEERLQKDQKYVYPSLFDREPKEQSAQVISQTQQQTEEASDISDTPYMTQRKLAYGWAQEPTIAGSLYRLGKAKFRSFISDKTYEEAARDIEAARQEEIRKEFPDLFGKEEDLTILAGRMGLAIADPVTLFIPWLKAAKAGKLATGALGASVAVGDVALREKALYGEVSGSSLALAAGLGSTSSLLMQRLLPIQKSGKETFETINDSGLKIKKYINIGGKAVENPLLKIRRRKKLIEEYSKYNKTGDEILGRYGTIIQQLIDNNKNAGFHFTQRTVINKDIRILEQEVIKVKEKFQGLPVAEVTRLEKDLLAAQKKYDLNEEALQKILFEQLPKDFGQSAFVQFDTALKNGLFNEQGVAQWFMQELTSPLIGAAGGFAFGVTTADEDNTISYVYNSILVGAAFGQFRKHINRANYNIRERTAANEALTEGQKIYERTFLAWSKDLFAGTHSAKLQAGIGSVRKFGAKLFNIQGGGLKQDTVLGESVEEARHMAMNTWSSVGLGEVIGNSSFSTVIAAGRILNQKNMSATSKHSFLKKGDLENKEAVKLADDLENFTNEFKKYVKSVGIQFTEADQYGLTQLLRKDLLANKGKTRKELSEAFKIQFINDWNKGKLQLKTSGDFKGRYVHIDDLDKTGESVRNYSRAFINDALGKKSKKSLRVDFNTWAKTRANNYIDGQTGARKHSLWADDIDFFDEASLKQKMFRNRADQEEDVIITAARHFENERVIYDQEARAFLSKKGYFEADPILTLQTLISETVPVVEFARVFGAKGEGLQDVFKGIRQEINRAARGDATIETNRTLQALAEKQINDVKNSVDAYFGMYQIDRTYKTDWALTAVAALQAVLSTTKLTKVALPSLGDLVQTFKNSGFSATRAAAIKHISRKRGEDTSIPSEVLGLRARRPVEGKLASDMDYKDVVWNQRLYNGLLEREMKNWMIEINPNNAKQVMFQKYQQRFFEIVQLGRITRFAREFAYDAGAIRAWQLSQKVNKQGVLPKRFQNEAARLGLDINSVKYLSKFKSIDNIAGDSLGEKLINRAGFKSAERDALIPTVGNRRLFSQSRDPTIRFLGSFLSWAQAKTSQTNALISRVEGGDAALAIRMLGAMPIFMAVRNLQLDLNASEEWKKSALVSESPDISSNLKRWGDAVIFSAEVIPWYADKGINLLRGFGSEGVTDLVPVLGLMNDLSLAAAETITEATELDTDSFISGVTDLGEASIPFFKDVNRGKGFLNPILNPLGKPIGMSLEDWLKGERYGPLQLEYESNPLELEYMPEDYRYTNFQGGKVSEDYPVPNAPVVPMERKDRMGNQSYATQASAESINPFTGEPYTAIYKKPNNV